MDEQQESESPGMVGQFGPSLAPSFPQWALSMDDPLSIVEHYLQGEVIKAFDDKQDPIWEKRFEPIINQRGTFELMRFLRGLVSKNTALSKVSTEQAMVDCRINALAVARMLRLRWREFELSPASYRFLCNEMNNFIEFTILKADKGWMLERFKTETRDIHSSVTQNQPKQQSGGFWSGLFGGSGQ